MNRNRPYLNRHIKLKQQSLIDDYHSLNLLDIRILPTRIDDHFHSIPINKSKTTMIRQERAIQIQRQNKSLLQRMTSIMGRRGTYSVDKTKKGHSKASLTLNDVTRRKQLASIQEQNKKLLQRLKMKKATVNLQKLNKQWQDNRGVVQRRANREFNLTNLKGNRTIHTSSFNRERNTYTSQGTTEGRVSRVKVVDGQKMLIIVQVRQGALRITGDCQDGAQLKLIQVPREDSKSFLRIQCRGRLQKVFDRLRYNAKEQALYLMSNTQMEPTRRQLNDNPEAQQIVLERPKISGIRHIQQKKAQSQRIRAAKQQVVLQTKVDANSKQTVVIKMEQNQAKLIADEPEQIKVQGVAGIEIKAESAQLVENKQSVKKHQSIELAEENAILQQGGKAEQAAELNQQKEQAKIDKDQAIEAEIVDQQKEQVQIVAQNKQQTQVIVQHNEQAQIVHQQKEQAEILENEAAKGMIMQQEEQNYEQDIEIEQSGQKHNEQSLPQ